MIDLKEIRIGNKLQIGSEIVTAEEICSDGLETPEEGFLSYSHTQLSGIPLTPELLKNWCYEINVDIEYGFKQYTGKLARATKDSDWWRLYSRWGHTIGDTIQYVHQLQNLYFALTRTELTFNPKP